MFKLFIKVMGSYIIVKLLILYLIFLFILVFVVVVVVVVVAHIKNSFILLQKYN